LVIGNHVLRRNIMKVAISLKAASSLPPRPAPWQRINGAIPAPVDAYDLWGDALKEWRRMAPDVRIINLETSITRSDAFAPKTTTA
jgi:poly-gamma-glutamate capsule biosynthesis protein CapA/YwtB (metallophosphatase superfamily)